MNEIGRALRNLGDGIGTDCCEKTISADSCPTILNSLETKRDRLQQQLTDVQEAIQAMKENPQIERVLNLLAKTGR